MTTNEYLPDRRVLVGFLVIGLVLAAGMLLMLEPKALAVLSGKPGTQGTQVNVTIPDGVASNPALSFTPRNLILKVNLNNTIVWTDNDTGGQDHTVTTRAGGVPSSSASFDSGPLSLGDTFSITPTIPGTYQYHCIFHGWMQGTITLLPP